MITPMNVSIESNMAGVTYPGICLRIGYISATGENETGADLLNQGERRPVLDIQG